MAVSFTQNRHPSTVSHHRLNRLMFYNEACVNGREELFGELFMAFRLQHSLTGRRAVMLNFIQLKIKTDR